MNGRPRLAVLGTGYLGATHAVWMASLGSDHGRNALDPALWRMAGWNYRAPGVTATRPPSRLSAVRQSPTGGRPGRFR